MSSSGPLAGRVVLAPQAIAFPPPPQACEGLHRFQGSHPDSVTFAAHARQSELCETGWNVFLDWLLQHPTKHAAVDHFREHEPRWQHEGRADRETMTTNSTLVVTSHLQTNVVLERPASVTDRGYTSAGTHDWR